MTETSSCNDTLRYHNRTDGIFQRLVDSLVRIVRIVRLLTRQIPLFEGSLSLGLQYWPCRANRVLFILIADYLLHRSLLSADTRVLRSTTGLMSKPHASDNWGFLPFRFLSTRLILVVFGWNLGTSGEPCLGCTTGEASEVQSTVHQSQLAGNEAAFRGTSGVVLINGDEGWWWAPSWVRSPTDQPREHRFAHRGRREKAIVICWTLGSHVDALSLPPESNA